MSSSTKPIHTLPHYELLYHPGIPGRGEFIRLALEATHTPYTDVANASDEGTFPRSHNPNLASKS